MPEGLCGGCGWLDSMEGSVAAHWLEEGEEGEEKGGRRKERERRRGGEK